MITAVTVVMSATLVKVTRNLEINPTHLSMMVTFFVAT
jgi:hypothetical protein